MIFRQNADKNCKKRSPRITPRTPKSLYNGQGFPIRCKGSHSIPYMQITIHP